MNRADTHTQRAYITGFVLAFILTAIPFGLAWSGLLPVGTTLIVIVIAAIIQVFMHLHYFLHLNFTTTPCENLLALAFAAILIFIMVGDSIWIMFDLHYRMMGQKKLRYDCRRRSSPDMSCSVISTLSKTLPSSRSSRR